MKPQGLRFAIKRSSAAVNAVPAQPTMRAPTGAAFATPCSVAVDDAVALAGGDQRIADAGRGIARRDGPDALPVARRTRYVRLGDPRCKAPRTSPLRDPDPVILGERLGSLR